MIGGAGGKPRGRSEKATEKRRVRKTEEEISKGRMWERNRMWWRGRKSA